MDKQITILLADGHSLFREAVRAALENEPDLTVVAEAGESLQAVAEAERCRPAVAFIGATLPKCDGPRTTKMIKARLSECRVLVLTDHDDESILLDSIEAGASGYLTKEAPLADLIHAAHAIDRGETLVPPHMLGALLARLTRRKREKEGAYPRVAKLTRREQEVLRLLVDGYDNGGIAQTLVISAQTARTHIQNILFKLEVHSRLQAVALVRRSGTLEELMEVEA